MARVAAETKLTIGGREITLLRPDADERSPLRAWTAADRLALDHLAEISPDGGLGNVLIVNDQFGALTVGLAHAEPTVWSDSAAARTAIDANLARNDCHVLGDRVVAGTDMPAGLFDTVVIVLPKTLSLLEYQLGVVASVVHAESRIVGLAMARNITRSSLSLFEATLGTTTTSLARQKARLVHASPNALAPASDPFIAGDGYIADGGVHVASSPGLFSSDRLDVGSRLLIDTMIAADELMTADLALDLGCGSGVIAASLAKRSATATWTLCDVSDLAVAAAQSTWERNKLGGPATFIVADGAAGCDSASFDLVVTNPPFHQDHAVDNALTERILAEAARVLTNEGSLFVVAQRHLHLHTRMRRHFSSVDAVSKHPSHVVIRAVEPIR